MTRSADDKLDDVLDRLGEIATAIAVVNEWKNGHEERHNRESGWRRWLVPTLISLCSLVIVLLKFH